MFISKSADYAFRALIYLARQEPKKYAAVLRIARDCRVPAALLSKILQSLVRLGFLKSRKGHMGGFRLGRAAEAISLMEVITAVDGDMCIVDCVREDEACCFSPGCALYEIGTLAERKLAEMFRSITLADCAARAREPAPLAAMPAPPPA